MFRHATNVSRFVLRAVPGGCRSYSKKIEGSVDFNKALVFKKHGDPTQVVELENYSNAPLPEIKRGQVRVKMLNAPINLTDLWNIQGSTTKNISLPAVPGDGGVGVIENPGDSSLERGDWVIPARPGLGTWRSFLVADAQDLIKIPNTIHAETASCLFGSPIAALRLLDDFVKLECDDVVIQNGGSGLLGQTLVQLGKQRGIKVISVMRERGLDEYGDVIERTKKDGAFIAISEDQIQTPRFKELISDLPAPKLAINVSGGQSATNIARLLGEGGTMVNVSNASKQPVFLPTGLFINKDIKLKSFNLENWAKNATQSDRERTIRDLVSSVERSYLNLWIETFDMWEYKTAFTEMMYPKERKYVFALHDNGIE